MVWELKEALFQHPSLNGTVFERKPELLSKMATASSSGCFKNAITGDIEATLWIMFPVVRSSSLIYVYDVTQTGVSDDEGTCYRLELPEQIALRGGGLYSFICNSPHACKASSFYTNSCLENGTCNHIEEPCQPRWINTPLGLLVSLPPNYPTPTLSLSNDHSATMLNHTHFFKWSEHFTSITIGNDTIHNPNSKPIDVDFKYVKTHYLKPPINKRLDHIRILNEKNKNLTAKMEAQVKKISLLYDKPYTVYFNIGLIASQVLVWVVLGIALCCICKGGHCCSCNRGKIKRAVVV
eukprot:sb/3467508/